MQREVMAALARVAEIRPEGWVLLRDLAGGREASRSDVEKTRRAMRRLADERLIEMGYVYAPDDNSSRLLVARKFLGTWKPNLTDKEDEQLYTYLWIETEKANEQLQLLGSRYRVKVEYVGPAYQAQVISLGGTPLFEYPYDPRPGASLDKPMR
ncbi:hypothetical protein DKG34_40365 [Streptomyces sp. NWU49]|nr:hypothetical protein DKG34_40365 [Streptomyces sp. NWU49]